MSRGGDATTGNEQASIRRAGVLNVPCVLPESSEVETLIACAVLAPGICAIVSDVCWDITAVDGHDVLVLLDKSANSAYECIFKDHEENDDVFSISYKTVDICWQTDSIATSVLLASASD